MSITGLVVVAVFSVVIAYCVAMLVDLLRVRWYTQGVDDGDELTVYDGGTTCSDGFCGAADCRRCHPNWIDRTRGK